MPRRLWGPALTGMLIMLCALPAAAQTPRTSVPARTTSTSRAFEVDLLGYINTRRAKIGCPRLTANSYLHLSANAHTGRMSRANQLSHQLSGEAALGPRITAAGYTRWKGLAENLAKGGSTAAAVYSMWMNSSMHKANLQNCFLHDAGIGMASVNGTTWVTLDLGRR